MSSKRNKGQSTAEFILAFAFMALFVMVFVQMGLNYAKGFIIHYASFMTSRAYYTFDNASNTPGGTDNPAKSHARDQVLKVLIKTSEIKKTEFFPPGSNIRSFFSGVVLTFREPFSPSALVGGTDKVNFKSESFLGRTVTTSECANNICTLFSSGLNASCSDGNITLFDNGC